MESWINQTLNSDLDMLYKAQTKYHTSKSEINVWFIQFSTYFYTYCQINYKYIFSAYIYIYVCVCVCVCARVCVCVCVFGLVWCLVPQFMLTHYWKANDVNDVKRRGQKNIQNKAVQTKSNLYINKYIKRKYYKTLRIF